jgi:hypothetical protein
VQKRRTLPLFYLRPELGLTSGLLSLKFATHAQTNEALAKNKQSKADCYVILKNSTVTSRQPDTTTKTILAQLKQKT